MPRFFFHIHDGQSLHDHAGTELPDWTSARLHAITIIGQILASEPERIPLGEDWCMEVTDAAGLVLFRLDFYVAASPAVRQDRLKKEKH